MSTTIDQLELEVQSNAQSAVSGVDALASSLGKLKTAIKGGLGLQSVQKQLTSLNSGLNALSSENAKKLNKLADGLRSLRGLENLKISSSIGNQIKNIVEATKSIESTNFQSLNTLVSSLGVLKDIPDGNLGKVISQFRRLPEAIKELNAVDTGAVFDKLAEVASSFAPLSSMGKNGLTSFLTQLRNIPKVMNELKAVDMSSVFDKLSELPAVFAPLTSMGKNGLSSFVTSLRNIPKMMKELNEVDFGTLKSKVLEVAEAFTPLATQMQSIANGFSALPRKLQKLIQSTDKLSTSNGKASKSYINLAAQIHLVKNAIQGVVRVFSSWITKSNQYIEDMNLFKVSMGEYAEEAYKFAENVSDVMGIDPAEWMRNQGIFMTLAKGFGVAGDRAHTMSQNLTQLAYDLSSFFNISTADAFAKLQSGIAGELEPLRRIGYDLSVARLQQEAYTLGIQKKVSAMTQAEKAELRYYAIMTQVTDAHHDMANTLNAPANQLRILKAEVTQCARAFGNLFIPILNAVLPYAIALFKVLRMLAEVIANLFGVSMPEVDFSSFADAAGGVSDMEEGIGNTADGLEDAAKKAKELKNALLGIDELNIISPPEQSDSGSSGSGAGSGIGGAGGLGFELPTYNFLEGAVGSKVDEIVKSMKEWLGLTEDIDTWSELFDTRLGDILIKIGEAAVGFLAWKLSKGFLGDLTALTTAIGATLLIDSIIATVKDGLSWKSVIEGAIAGAIMGASLGFKFGGWRGAIGGIVIGIGVSLLINGITSMIAEGVNVENVIATISGALATVGGIVTVIKLFNLKNKTPVKDFDTAGKTIADVSKGTSTVTTKLASLAKNLGLGLVIIAEVAAAALLITGAIALLGMELEAVGNAWSPVVENGEMVLTGMGLGTAILVVIGGITAALGSAGASVAAQIGIGMLILVEIGAAALLFLAEIYLVGKALDDIGKAWQPVLDNGETIATGIGIGTALLVGIGVVTAALGVATVATAGLLPLAIGLGTALLVELSVALVLFIESLVVVADSLSKDLSPALNRLNKDLPSLSDNMGKFVDFMTEFAGHVVRYTEVSAIAALSGTIDTIVGWFTEDPIDKLRKDVEKISRQTSDLNTELAKAIPELEKASGMLEDYQTCLSELESLTNNNVQLSTGMFVNMEEVGQNLVTGFVSGIKSKSSEFGNAAKELVNGFKDSLKNASEGCKSSMTALAANVKKWFTDNGYGAINRNTFLGYGKVIVSGFGSGVTSEASASKSSITTWASDIKQWFGKEVSYSIFYNIAKDVVDGFNKGINEFYDTTEPYMRRWANAAKEAYKKELDSHSPSKVFMRIGQDTVLGYNLGIESLADTTNGIVTRWANSFTSVSPTMSFAVDTSALRYYSSDSFARSVSASVTGNASVTATGFKEGMEEFYREYVEPTMSQMAADVRRQADKNEQTVVQVGNRVVSEAVTTQRRANGYDFVK